jgi:hypothetical protein
VRRLIRRRPVMATRDRLPRDLTLSPGLGYEQGLKGLPQTQRAAKPFNPGLGYEPGLKVPNKLGPIGAVSLSVYGATWPGLWSRSRTRPGPKRPDERPVFY